MDAETSASRSLRQLRMSAVGTAHTIKASQQHKGSAMKRTRAFITGALVALAVGGCIAVPVHVSSVEQDLATKADPIAVGEADRVGVRQALGTPLVGSDYWQFDAFQITERNVVVAVFAGGIPLPAWNKEDGYILVAYGDDGRVADVQHGLRYDAMWAYPVADMAEVAVTARDVQLRATGDETFLAVPPSRRDAYLQGVPASGSCRVLVGAVVLAEDVAIVVDGQPGQKLPATWNDTLLLLRLAPGSHRIEAVARKVRVPAIAEIQCASDEWRYVSLSSATGAGASRDRSAEFTVSEQMPEGFRYQALLIWGNGQWLVEAEPGR